MSDTRRIERQRRALEVLEELLELAPEHHQVFLASACGDDDELRDAVEALAAADSDAAATGDTPLLSSLLEPGLTGHQLGPWRIGEQLGRGGMATVYAGERADGTYQQHVAVKVIRLGADDADFLRRFEDERRILAHLEHPNVARVMDGGSTADGRPYLVMELVDGAPIDEWCDQHQLSVGERLQLLISVCRAVEHAHRNLVVHRDLKPANILVTDDGVPKLLDFGIAKVLDPDGPTEHTRTGLRALTPSYASPEQIAGDSAVTTASDVYSLGVLAFRILVGQLPYDLPDTRPATLERVICQLPPQRASSAAATASPEVAALRGTTPRTLARMVRGDLDTILAVALEKRPTARYPSVEALRADLERHLEGRPVRARRPSIPYRLGRWTRRYRWAVVTAAVVALVIAGGVAATLWQARRATREAAKVEATNAFLLSMLAAPNPRESGSEVTVAEILGDASARLDRDRGLDPALAAALRRTLTRTYLGLGLYDEAETQAHHALEAARATLDRLEIARSQVALGAVLTAQRDLESAEPILREAIATLDPGSTAAAEAHDNLAVLLSRSGREPEAIPEFRTAIDGYRARGIDDVRLATALNDLGVAFGRRGELATAEPLHREAYRMMHDAYGDSHPGTAEALANLAGAVDAAGRHQEAEPLYREAVTIQTRLEGEDHPEVIALTTSQAFNLLLLGRLEDAEATAVRATATADRVLTKDHPLSAYAHAILGQVLLAEHRFGAAEPHLRLAVEARRRSLPQGHWLTASAETALGEALDGLGRDDEAEDLLRSSYDSLLADRGPDHERTVAAREALLAFYHRRGRPEASTLGDDDEDIPPPTGS